VGPGDAVLAPGAHVGPYRLVRRAGQGASGEVFLALDAGTGRAVALKVLAVATGEAGDPPSHHFTAEARTLRALTHPDIVSVFDSGEWMRRPWMAMEWLPGHDLTRYTEPARLLPEVLVLEIAERLARALAFAHGKGVVHRDVKPGNVRIDLPNGRLKLADFGVARAEDAAQTRTGVVLGTPVYMAPEQLAGAAASASGDLYSLGVVIYELLTGRRPHESASMGELLRKVATEPAPDVRTLRPALPPALAAELARALARRPADRPADGSALADALARVRVHIKGPGDTG
jgi:eukaryotic-like serine/threonine-protein kinase